ncbi:MAG: hypothetical protein HPY83_18450 [Anaerolineae bacterium]|nr:hypothetical protein [Anaerolineae bacterium]
MRLAVSDAQSASSRPLDEVPVGAGWQRCRVHFMRNLLARVPKSAQAMVAATVRSIFRRQSREQAQAQLAQVCALLRPRFPKAVELLEEGEEEILAFYDFPAEHWRQIYSTNPLERLNRGLKRRGAVVGIFPNRQSVIRLLGALLAEQNDEWLVERRYFSEASMRKIAQPAARSDPALVAARECTQPTSEAPAPFYHWTGPSLPDTVTHSRAGECPSHSLRP